MDNVEFSIPVLAKLNEAIENAEDIDTLKLLEYKTRVHFSKAMTKYDLYWRQIDFEASHPSIDLSTESNEYRTKDPSKELLETFRICIDVSQKIFERSLHNDDSFINRYFG